MTPKERVKNIIARKSYDMIPYSFDLTSHITNMIAGYYGITPGEVHEFIGDNMLYIGHGNPDGIVNYRSPNGEYRDEFGVLWNSGDAQRNIGDWGEIIEYPLTEPSLDNYIFPNGGAPGRFSHIDAEKVRTSERYVVLGITGLLDTCWHLRGFENFFADLVEESAFVNNLLDMAAEYITGVVKQAPDYIDGVRFTEDWGLQHGLMMNPVLWRKLLKPRLKKMYNTARERGFNVLIHSCGDILELFPDLIELGVEVVHPIQPEAMDVEFLKREYGSYVVLYGGIGCQSTLPFGTPDDVTREAAMRLDILGRDGGYILGPAGAIPTDARLENVIALVEFCRNGY